MTGQAPMHDTQLRKTAYISATVGFLLWEIPAADQSWRGSMELHTLLETTATLLAFVLGSIALVRYYTQKQIQYLLIGDGFVGAGALDGYHALVSSTFFSGHIPSALPMLTPWTGLASRILLSAVFCVTLLQPDSHRRSKAHNQDFRIHLAVGASTLLSFLLFALVPL